MALAPNVYGPGYDYLGNMTGPSAYTPQQVPFSAVGGNVGASGNNTSQLLQAKAGGYGGTGSTGGGGGTPAAPSGPSGQDQQVNDAYGDVYKYLDQLQSGIEGGKQNYLNAATAGYDAYAPQIDASLTQGLNLNQNQVGQENQLAAQQGSNARSLFNEFQQGAQQRFGGQGASSTGDFANAFYNRELAKNLGGIANTQGQNLNNLATQAQNLHSQHDSAMQQLNAQKAAALAQAQSAFQDRLDQINQMRGQAAQGKAQMQLQLLNQLKYAASYINDQYQAASGNLNTQLQSGLSSFSQNVNQYNQMAQQPTQTGGYANPQYSGINQQGGAGYSGQPVGYAGSQPRYDQYGNRIG